MARPWVALPVVLVVLVAATLVPAVPAAAAPSDLPWRPLLDRAAQAAEELAYAGEVLWITHDDGGPGIERLEVTSSGNGEISVVRGDEYAVRLGTDRSGLAAYERGWFVPLPAADLSKAHKGLSRLEEKYTVGRTGTEYLLDRPCTTLVIRRRSDAELVERLWIDDETNLLLRRETYDGEERLLRLVSYLSLEFDPQGRAAVAAAAASRRREPLMTQREQDVAEVDDDRLDILRAAGWTVPDLLPGNYRPDGSFALAAEDSQPLQVVYSDGLYTLSLFEQRGAPDLASMSPGAQQTTEFGFEAYTWPGAVPKRMLWEVSGTTFLLVGDAPPDDFQAIVQALPHPEPDGVVDRLRRGLSRLWSWVSPWS